MLVALLVIMSPFIVLFLVTYWDGSKAPSLYELVSTRFEAKLERRKFRSDILIFLPHSRVQARLFLDHVDDANPRRLCLETRITQKSRHFAFILKKKFSLMDITPWGIQDVAKYTYFPSRLDWKKWVMKIDENHSLLEVFDSGLLERLRDFEQLTPEIAFDGEILRWRSEALLGSPFPPERFKRLFGPSLIAKREEELKRLNIFPDQLAGFIALFDELALRLNA